MVSQIWNNVASLFVDFKDADASASTSVKQVPLTLVWHCTIHGIVKINVNGGFPHNSPSSGICAVIQNNYGDLMDALSKLITKLCSPLAVELMAM